MSFAIFAYKLVIPTFYILAKILKSNILDQILFIRSTIYCFNIIVYSNIHLWIEKE